MLVWFKCPDGQSIEVKECLAKCRMEHRCLTTPTLRLISKEREWNGVASTTQLLNGTMEEFLKLTMPYAVDPDKRMFSLAGTMHHHSLEESAKELGLPSEVALSIDRDIFDLLEPADDLVLIQKSTGEEVERIKAWCLTDYKLWGSFKLVTALGIVEIGKRPSPNGDIYKVSGKWGKAGSPKLVSIWKQDPEKADLWEQEMQLNRYRTMLERKGVAIVRMQLQVMVRDGGLAVAHSRGIERNSYIIPIKQLDDNDVEEYFAEKEYDLAKALELGECITPCNNRECWDDAKCRGYCDVKMYCPKGSLFKE